MLLLLQQLQLLLLLLEDRQFLPVAGQHAAPQVYVATLHRGIVHFRIGSFLAHSANLTSCSRSKIEIVAASRAQALRCRSCEWFV